MDKLEKFLIKIQSKNKKRKLLKEKKATYAKLINIPYAIDECLKLDEEIKFLELELKD